MQMEKPPEKAASPQTQVQPRPTRRVFSLQYKRSIVEQAAACTLPGEVGALLRREGLYSSHLVDWRRQHDRGELQGYGPLRRGPVAQEKALPPAADAQQQRIEQLER
jgi:transposase-like protein